MFGRTMMLMAVLTSMFIFSVASAAGITVVGSELKLRRDFSPATSVYLYTDNGADYGPGVFTMSSIGNDSGQLYAGPRLKAYSFLEVGVGAGIEMDGTGGDLTFYRRYAALVFTNTPIGGYKLSSNYFYERTEGGGAAWQRFEAFYDATPSATLGLMIQSRAGIGPRIGYSLPKGGTLWNATLLRAGELTNISSITFAF